MAHLIFIGDMLVSGFMVVVAVWLFWRTDDEQISKVAQIPLQDEGDA